MRDKILIGLVLIATFAAIGYRLHEAYEEFSRMVVKYEQTP